MMDVADLKKTKGERPPGRFLMQTPPSSPHPARADGEER